MLGQGALPLPSLSLSLRGGPLALARVWLLCATCSPEGDSVVSALCGSGCFRSQKCRAHSGPVCSCSAFTVIGSAGPTRGPCAAVVRSPSLLGVCVTFMKEPQFMYPAGCRLTMDRFQFFIVGENAVTISGRVFGAHLCCECPQERCCWACSYPP